MKVYEALAKAFLEEGTKKVFGLMGSSNQRWINALDRIGVFTYEVRHEGPGLGAAETLGRLSGTVGVCTTTEGPGMTQLSTMMVYAARAKSPLVAFCGDTPPTNNHGFNQARFADAIECAFVRVTDPETAYAAVQKAFYIAKTEGPVILCAPRDIQMMTFDDTEDYVPSSALINSTPQVPHPDAIAQAVEMMTAAKRPVIVVGRGAMMADAGDAVLSLARRTGALIATSLLAKNWNKVADEHNAGVAGLYASKIAMELFQEADCVVGVGASLNHYTMEGGYIFPEARFIQIDKAQQFPLGNDHLAECYVQSDARLGVEALDKALAQASFSQEGYRTPAVAKTLTMALDDPVVYELMPDTVDPREACKVLDEALPESIGIVMAGAHCGHSSIMMMSRPRPFVYAYKYFGTMSKGMAGVLGAAVASGGPTCLIEGDAGFMMYVGEFETAVRYKLPILVVILNDQALGEELHKVGAVSDLNDELAMIPTADLGKVGVAFGGRGSLVTTLDGLREAVAEFVANPAPTLLDVRISLNVVAVQKRRRGGDDRF